MRRSPKKPSLVEGEHFPHVALWQASEALHSLANSVPIDESWSATVANSAAALRSYPQGAALVYTYFALEAYLNFLGKRVAPAAWKDERTVFSRPPHRGTRGKLDFLLAHLGISLDKERRPYTTIRELEKRRDGLVHPKRNAYSKRTRARTMYEIRAEASRLTALADPKLYLRARQDVEHVCDLLHQYAGIVEPGFGAGKAFVGPTSVTTRYFDVRS
jgi:hypothetical protein